jgi:hypothetical protein
MVEASHSMEVVMFMATLGKTLSIFIAVIYANSTTISVQK